MRLAGVAIMRNECDIAEAFVRHHAALLDHLYVLDNWSSDATPIILEKLAAEGLPITWMRDKDGTWHQGRKTTELVRYALDDGAYDFVFPLDGDEFLRVSDRPALETGLSLLPDGGPALLENTDYIPTADDDMEEVDATRRIVCFGKVTPATPPRVCKVVIPKALTRQIGFSVFEGNHHAQVGSDVPPHHRMQSASIAHFPVRSVEQFVSKVVVSRLAWLSRSDYNPNWSRHFGKFYEELKIKSYPTAQDLQEAALFYLDKNFHPSPFSPEEQRPYQITLVRSPLIRTYDRLRYIDLMTIAALPRILDMAQFVAEELREARNKVITAS